MSQFYIIINQISILGILITVGFIAAKFKVIDDSVKSSIARLITKITLPALILISITNLELTGDMLRNGILVLVMAYLFLFLLYFIGIISSRILNLPRLTRDVYVTHFIFGNTVFLGLPLVQALYPDGEGVFYAVLYNMASDTLLYTLGIYLLGRHKTNDGNQRLKNLINSNTIAFAIGVLMLTFRLKLPGIINSSLGSLGSTTIYLSMLFIGATLAGINLKGVYKKYSLIVLSVLKMIITPILVIFIFKFINLLPLLRLNHIAQTVLILFVAMPAMAVVVIFAKDLESDYIYASENMFLSTVFSLITLPLVYFFIEMLM